MSDSDNVELGPKHANFLAKTGLFHRLSYATLTAGLESAYI